MSYQHDRDSFIATVTREGLPLHVAITLLRTATTINRLAELACSSEAADRDRIMCPRKHAEKLGYSTQKIDKAVALATRYPCLCDAPVTGHETIPRIRLQDYQAEQRAVRAMPVGWAVQTAGDPRGYTLRIIPPSYAERNAGRDSCNLDSIGVPSRDSRLRF